MDIPADWTFKNAQVADGFDRHVREQLPWYDLATGAIAHIARHYIPDQGLVYDIGASTGNIGRALGPVLAHRRAELMAIEASAEMAARYRGPGELRIADARDFEFQDFDVAICFLVLMFMPPRDRKGFVRSLCERIRPGGALIVFDKVATQGGYLSTVLHRLTIAGKVATGVDSREIIAKELSLSGVQRPLDPGFMALATHPQAVEVFRFGEFAGWVVERSE